MVRSMYSGVAGMKTHQTRMDVIGNNIANVNTYGFKSSRATFRDVYYQTMRGASQGTANRGGMNPTQVGYGSQLSSIDVLQTQSVMSTTGNPLDVAITGDGFLQVQDTDGNVFFTKAGMLDIDANGNLVDLNGNFVLGVSGSPVGKAPGSDRIQFNIPSVAPAVAGVTEEINTTKITITAQNQTQEGNVTFNFSTDPSMPIGQKASAVVSSSGISIKINPKEVFTTQGDLESAINQAILDANNGKPHPGGTFTVTVDPSTKFPPGGLTGEEVCGINFGYKKGTLPVAPTGQKLFGGFSLNSVGDKFSGNGIPSYTLVHRPANATASPPTDEEFDFTVTIAGGGTYTKTIKASQMQSSGSILMNNNAAGSDPADTITMNFPSYSSIVGSGTSNGQTPPTYTFTAPVITDAATPSVASKDLGLSKPFKLQGGTKGGPQGIKDLSGISIGADGVIVASHPILGKLEIGRIDLAVFDNPAGLEQAGNTYFMDTANSGPSTPTQPGGAAGALKSSALETSNVDLSQEFSDMITTQRGFQANSRLITVSDTMLEELINLKR